MKPLVSCAESARIDSSTLEAASLPSALLMEDAALRMWQALVPFVEQLSPGCEPGGIGNIVALCGTGNNGGDALAILRFARFAGYTKLAVIMARDGIVGLAAEQLGYLRSLDVPIYSWESAESSCRSLLETASFLIDGLAGIGLRGPLGGNMASLAAAAFESGKPVVAIDLPSGMRDDWVAGDPVLPAALTLCIEPRKLIIYHPRLRELCGQIIPIGELFPVDTRIEPSAWLLEGQDLAELNVSPDPSSHKGSRGKLAVFAGSLGATGAASMASRAALAAGAGLCSLFAAPEIMVPLSSRLESVMVKPESSWEANSGKGGWDAVLVGPGWGRSEARLDRLRSLITNGLPAVLDADAIHLLARIASSGWKNESPLVLTPHPGEFEALTGIPPAVSLAQTRACLIAAARDFQATIVLKSHVTWICSPDGRISVWEGLEPGLATAGSGDVLAGLIAGILASSSARGNPDAYKAAQTGVVAHGLAGRSARTNLGWFEAPDLIPAAGLALGSLARSGALYSP